MTLKSWIEANQANGIIQWSLSLAAPWILFAQKICAGLRQWVCCRTLTQATVKNRYPIPLFLKLLICFWEARIFKQLDLTGAYNLIGITACDEYTTAFQTN